MKKTKKSKQDSAPRTSLFPRGQKNSITDVPGVKAGHLTIQKDFQDGPEKAVSIRTGLTAVLPYAMEKEIRVFAGFYILNGKGEMTGYETMDDFCYLNSPVVVTNSFNVGVVYNAILSYGFALKRAEVWPPLVIGVDDSYLNDLTQHLFKEEEILGAFHQASDSPLEEGSMGAGIGLRALGWKGGIGSASRILTLGERQFTLGVLVASNHGNQDSNQAGDSLTVVAGTDIPVLPHQIKRIVPGLAASFFPGTEPGVTDSISCLLFSTANPMSMENEGPRLFDYQMIDDSFLGQIIGAGREAVGEAILNSLLKAAPVQGKSGRVVRTIPDSELAKVRQRMG
jgi:D-aminopeptidase